MNGLRILFFCLVAIFAFALTPDRALACRGPQFELHVLLPTLPEQIEDDEIVLKVSRLSSEIGEDNILEAEVLEVIQGDWATETVDLEVLLLISCSRAMMIDCPFYVVGTASVFEGRLSLREFRLSELRGYERLEDGRERFELP